MMNLLLAINTEKKTTCDAARPRRRCPAPPLAKLWAVGLAVGCWGDALLGRPGRSGYAPDSDERAQLGAVTVAV